MISLIASPDHITDEEIVTVTLTIDDIQNQQKYQGLYLNLIVRKVGSVKSVPTYQQRYNGQPLIWEINKYTYESTGTFQVSANVFDGPSITSCTFIVEEKCIYLKRNICNNTTNANVQNPNSRSINYPAFVQPSVNVSKVQLPGVDYLKPNNITPVSTFTQENPDINTIKVQRSSKNVNPGRF